MEEVKKKPTRPCSVDGCGKKHLAKSFCQQHFDAFRKYGNPLTTKRPLRNICIHDGCMEEGRTKSRCRKHYHQFWYEANKADKRVKNDQWKKDNPEKHRTNGRDWRYANPERAKEIHQRYQQNNPESVRANRKRYHEKHPEKRKQDLERYMNARKQRTPKWLTPEQHQQIREIYKARQHGQHTDHVLPLFGDIVSGLHVPWNLENIPATENMRKGSKFNFEEYKAKWLTPKAV